MMQTFNLGNCQEIDFEHFGHVWRYVNNWQNCFKKFDTDKSGSIRWVYEIRVPKWSDQDDSLVSVKLHLKKPVTILKIQILKLLNFEN